MEYWISKEPYNGLKLFGGHGSYKHPFYGDFDRILNALPVRCRIRLFGGVFRSSFYTGLPNEPICKLGQKISGLGEGITIVQRKTSPDRQCPGAFFTRDDDVSVSDLTVDCAGVGNEHYKVQGVSLHGNHCEVRRVTVIGSTGNTATGQECFAIYVGGIGTPSKEGLIEDCRVQSVRGDYCSAIHLSGSGSILRCHVDFPVVEKTGVLFQAYQCAGGGRQTLMGCDSDGGTFGFYNDTGDTDGLQVVGNTFANVTVGFRISKAKGHGYLTRDVHVRENKVIFSKLAPLGGWCEAYGFINSDEKPYSRLSVYDNTAVYADGTTPNGRQVYLLLLDGPVLGAIVHGNVADSAFALKTSGSGLNVYGNFDLNGQTIQVTK